MPITPTYPGVYVEEIPSGVHTIIGVSTSETAFVDFFAQGPMNVATRITSFGDFQRRFGGLDTRSEASYAIQQYFLNGGQVAWVVRIEVPGRQVDVPGGQIDVPEMTAASATLAVTPTTTAPPPTAPPPTGGPTAPPPTAPPPTGGPTTPPPPTTALPTTPPPGTTPAPPPMFTVTAITPGGWGNSLQAQVFQPDRPAVCGPG
jgi:hypothetical protein